MNSLGILKLLKPIFEAWEATESKKECESKKYFAQNDEYDSSDESENDIKMNNVKNEADHVQEMFWFLYYFATLTPINLEQIALQIPNIF